MCLASPHDPPQANDLLKAWLLILLGYCLSSWASRPSLTLSMEAFFCIPEPFDSTEIQLSLGEVLTVALHSLGPHRKVQWVCELSEASLAPSGAGVSPGPEDSNCCRMACGHLLSLVLPRKKFPCFAVCGDSAEASIQTHFLCPQEVCGRWGFLEINLKLSA